MYTYVIRGYWRGILVAMCECGVGNLENIVVTYCGKYDHIECKKVWREV
jgi:transposase